MAVFNPVLVNSCKGKDACDVSRRLWLLCSFSVYPLVSADAGLEPLSAVQVRVRQRLLWQMLRRTPSSSLLRNAASESANLRALSLFLFLFRCAEVNLNMSCRARLHCGIASFCACCTCSLFPWRFHSSNSVLWGLVSDRHCCAAAAAVERHWTKWQPLALADTPQTCHLSAI